MSDDAVALDDLIDALLEDQLDAAGARRLEQWVKEDPKARRYFVQRVHLDADVDAVCRASESGLRLSLPAGVPQYAAGVEVSLWRGWRAAAILILGVLAISVLHVEAPPHGTLVRQVGEVAMEHHPDGVIAKLGRGWMAWSWRGRGQMVVEGPAEVHLHADGLKLVTGRVWMRAGRHLPLRLQTAEGQWHVSAGQVGAISDAGRELLEIHALQGSIVSDNAEVLAEGHALVFGARQKPVAFTADTNRFVRAIDAYGPTRGGGLLLADRFAYEPGRLEGRHAGFERAPVARWLGPWTYFRPMSEDTVFAVKDEVVRVSGPADIHENMLRAFVIDQPQGTSTWFSIRMRVF